MTLPTGTVTFLRSDIEGSMEHARALGARYDELNAEHAAIVRAAVAEHGGAVVRTEGDAFFVVFTEAGPAARAAVAIQRAMAGHDWPAGHALRLRIGLHSGSATRAGDDYGGLEVSRAARIGDAGHGGQIVLSDPTRALIASELPDDWRIDELGRVRLKGLAQPEHLFGLLAPGLASAFEPLRSIESERAEHLPQRLSSFIGREAELTELAELLADTRLLTLVGPGGTGKTTLAVELARREARTYADEAWFVDLQAVTQADEVKPTIARALGLLDGSQGPAADRLERFIADRSLLLVIDNFEQVIAGSDVVSEVLAASPRSRCIVTSRIPLRVSAEQEYPLRPLDLEPSEGEGRSEAVRLFLERTRRTRPGRAFDADEIAVATDICRLLDGFPLAIELAAARTAILPLAVIRDRLAGRLPLPGSGPRDLPARQRTMESTVAWSYDLLEPSAQHLLACLSVFAGSFELEQAEVVCASDEVGDVLEGLVDLAEQSLLQRVDDAVGGLRFRMLETIAAFARRRLVERGGVDELRRRHARAYANLATTHPVSAWGPDRAQAIDRLEVDDENLSAALAFAVESADWEMAFRLLARLWRFWIISGRLREVLALAEVAMDLPGADRPSVERLGGLDAIGGLYYWAGDLAAARDCYEQQLALATELDERGVQGEAWYNLAYCLYVLGDPDAGMEAVAAAEAIFREIGDESWLTRIEFARSLGHTQTGTPQEQRAALLRHAERFDEFEDSAARSQALQLRAQAALLAGDIHTAVVLITQALRIAYRDRNVADMIIALQPVAIGTLQAGQPELAATLLGISLGEADRYGIMPPATMSEITKMPDPEGLFIEALGREGFEAGVAAGRRLTLADALDLLDAAAAQASEASSDAAPTHTAEVPT